MSFFLFVFLSFFVCVFFICVFFVFLCLYLFSICLFVFVSFCAGTASSQRPQLWEGSFAGAAADCGRSCWVGATGPGGWEGFRGWEDATEAPSRPKYIEVPQTVVLNITRNVNVWKASIFIVRVGLPY